MQAKYFLLLTLNIFVTVQLKLMATVHQTQPTIQLLLSTSDYVGALDLISTTQEVLQQELAGIQSFRYAVNVYENGDDEFIGNSLSKDTPVKQTSFRGLCTLICSHLTAFFNGLLFKTDTSSWMRWFLSQREFTLLHKWHHYCVVNDIHCVFN